MRTVRTWINVAIVLLISGGVWRAYSSETVTTRVHIFYYPWYDNPSTDRRWIHWNQNNHRPPDDIASNFYPKLGAYSSKEQAVLDQHMAWIAHSGVGVIVTSWWGRDSYEDLVVPMLLDSAAAHGLQVAFHIEPYEGRTADSVKNDIAYIYNRYRSHPAFFRVSRPTRYGYSATPRGVFYIFNSLAIPDNNWRVMLDSIRGTTLDACVLAQTSDANRIDTGHFDGIYTYDVFNVDGSFFQGVNQVVSRNAVFSPSVGPGYIDTRAVAGSNRDKPRANGVVYDQMWQRAIDSGAEWISITSFNEWHEGTQIEPAVPKSILGFTYLNYEDELAGTQAEMAYIERTRLMVKLFIKSLNPSDGFDFPLGPPDGKGYGVEGYGGLTFLEPYDYQKDRFPEYHPGEDWNDDDSGLDYGGDSNDAGDFVYAVSNGIVKYAGYHSSDLGYLVLIEHHAPDGSHFVLPDGAKLTTVWSRYAHMAGIDDRIQKDKPVDRGQPIGTVGDFPHNTGKNHHLHFEIRILYQDPGAFVFNTAPDEPWPESEVRKYYTHPSNFIKRNRSILPMGVQHSENYYIFLVDASGSMAGTKIEEVKKAVPQIVQDLPTKNNVYALIAYSCQFGDCTTPANMPIIVHFTNDAQQIISSVQSLIADGATPMRAGLEKAYQYASFIPPTSKGMIVLLADGQQNCPDGDIPPLDHIIIRYMDLKRKDNITLSCIAYGTGEGLWGFWGTSEKELNQTLEKLAREGGGIYVEARDPTVVKGKFREAILKKSMLKEKLSSGATFAGTLLLLLLLAILI